MPSLYNSGFQAERVDDTIEIWDTRANVLRDTLAITLPETYAAFDFATFNPCLLYWLNPPN